MALPRVIMKSIFAMLGFQPSLSRVRVGSRLLPPLRIVLTVAELCPGVTVDEETDPVTAETSQNLAAVSMNQKSLENLPVFDQDYVGMMSRLAPLPKSSRRRSSQPRSSAA
jgi:hypothetical protein